MHTCMHSRVSTAIPSSYSVESELVMQSSSPAVSQSIVKRFLEKMIVSLLAKADRSFAGDIV